MSLAKLRKTVWSLRTSEKLLKIPRQYANEVRLEDLDFESALIMGRSSARSPQNVQVLMKRYQTTSVDHLYEQLPDQRYHRRAWQRFKAALRRIGGGTAYNPDTARVRSLRRAGYITRPDLHARVQAIKEFQ